MLVGLFVVLTPLLPLIVLVTLAADGVRILVRRRASGITRLTLFGWWYVATVNLAETVDAVAASAGTYYLVVEGAILSQAGCYTLTVSVTPP